MARHGSPRPAVSNQLSHRMQCEQWILPDWAHYVEAREWAPYRRDIYYLRHWARVSAGMGRL